MKISNVLSDLKLEYSLRGDIDYNENISLANLDLEIINGELTDEEFHLAAIETNKKLQIAEFVMALKQHFGEVANSNGYDSEITIISYVNSTNDIWRDEALTYQAWRDDCWIYAHDLFNAVENSEISIPTIEGFMAGLPEIVW